MLPPPAGAMATEFAAPGGREPKVAFWITMPVARLELVLLRASDPVRPVLSQFAAGGPGSPRRPRPSSLPFRWDCCRNSSPSKTQLLRLVGPLPVR